MPSWEPLKLAWASWNRPFIYPAQLVLLNIFNHFPIYTNGPWGGCCFLSESCTNPVAFFWWTLNMFNSWLTVWNASAFKCRVICQRLLALVWCQPAVIRLRQFQICVWLGKGVPRLELKGWGKSQPNESDVLCRAPQKIIPEWRWWYTNTLSGISHYCDPNEPLITRQKPCHAKRYNRKRWARMGQNHGPNKSIGRFNSNCWKRYPLVHCYSLLWKITTLMRLMVTLQ